jgi:dihydrofolate reductase
MPLITSSAAAHHCPGSRSRDPCDLIKYGTSRFDNTLLRDHLIDEFRFWIMPVVAGSGQRLFEDVDTSGLNLRLTDERRLENGSVILTYAPG